MIKALLLALGIGCAAGAGALTVTDFEGREVRLAAPAERIVALSPHAVENVFSAGAGHKLVGVVDYSDYPPPARQLPLVGSAYAWSIESIVALQPDLVILWGSGSGDQGLETLKRLGLPVYVSEPRKLNDISRSLRDIGKLADTSEVAEQRAQAFDASLATLKRRFSQGSPVSVFYQVWHQPLQTLNGDHLVSQAIQLCGGRNIFASEASLAPRVSMEAVLERDPMVIVGSGMNGERPPWLDDWKAYPSLRAVRAQSLFFIHPDLIQRPTSRILQGIEQLCEQLDASRSKTD